MLFSISKIKEYIDPKIIFEFGSFNGVDSIRYGNAFPEAIVYCMEADPKNYQICLKHIQAHSQYKNIKLFDYAISDNVGIIDFFPGTFIKYIPICQRGIDDPGWSGSVLKQTNVYKEDQKDMQKFDETIKVPSITIEEFCKLHNIIQIDFMHVDVEGAIESVIKGLGNIRPKLIYAEVGSEHCNFQEFFTNSHTEIEHLEMFTKLKYTRVKRYRGNSLFTYRGIK